MVASSPMSRPVLPAAKPTSVAWPPSALRARATLAPLPPAWCCSMWARMVVPGCKLSDAHHAVDGEVGADDQRHRPVPERVAVGSPVTV